MAINRQLPEMLGQDIPEFVENNSFAKPIGVGSDELAPFEQGAEAALFTEGFSFNNDGIVSDDLNGWHPALAKKPKISLWRRAISAPESNPAWQIDFHLGFAARMALVPADFD